MIGDTRLNTQWIIKIDGPIRGLEWWMAGIKVCLSFSVHARDGCHTSANHWLAVSEWRGGMKRISSMDENFRRPLFLAQPPVPPTRVPQSVHMA